IAACAAIGLGIWAAVLSSSLDDTRSRADAQEQVLQVLGSPSATVSAVSGANGTLAVTPSGRAAIVLRGIRPAPSGKTYELWVIRGQAARREGLFSGSGGKAAVLLTRRVPRGSVVAVT